MRKTLENDVVNPLDTLYSTNNIHSLLFTSLGTAVLIQCNLVSYCEDITVYQDSKQPVIFGSLPVYGVLALAGITAPIIFVITNLIAAFSSYPDYNFIRDSISSLAWTPLGWVQTIGFVIMGLLIEVFIIGLVLSIRGGCIQMEWKLRWGTSILGLYGFGVLLVGAFRTDPVGGLHTVEGTIHGVSAGVVYWLFPIAGLLMAPCLRKQPYWKDLFLYTIIASIVALALLVIWAWVLKEVNVLGLYQRILVLDELMWVEIMAVWLLRISLRQPKT